MSDLISISLESLHPLHNGSDSNYDESGDSDDNDYKYASQSDLGNTLRLVNPEISNCCLHWQWLSFLT